MNIKDLLSEIKRRKIFKSALAYLVSAWVIIQVFSLLLGIFEVSNHILKIIFVVLCMVFPLWLVISWVYEITPDGIKKTVRYTGKESRVIQSKDRLNPVIIGGLTVIIILLVFNMFKSPAASSPENNELAETLENDQKSIAVLAFADMSPHHDQEYFSDGISEEILNLLAKISDLKVISRTSSFSFKDKDVTSYEIGKTLKVNHILEGSIRQSGNTIRITAQLINTKDGSQLWSHTYDRDKDDIFKVQDEIAGAVVKELKISLLGTNSVSATHNTEAHNLYLQGKYFSDKQDKASLELALEYFKKALIIDPDYALVLANMSGVYIEQADNGFILAKEGVEKAWTTLEKSLQIDPMIPDSYVVKGRIYADYEWNWSKANASLKKAIALDNRNSSALRFAGRLAMCLGQFDESIAYYQQSIELDPLQSVAYSSLSLVYERSGNLSEAETLIRKAIELNPASAGVYYRLAMIQLEQGQYEEALKSVMKESDEGWRLVGLPLVFFKLDRKAESDMALDKQIKELSNVGAYQIAESYAYRGDINLAFKWLTTAFVQNDAGLASLKVDPLLKNLHGDVRWQSLLKRMRFEADYNGN